MVGLGNDVFKKNAIHSFYCKFNMRNAYYSISNSYPLPFSGCTHQFLHACLTRVTGLGWTQKKAQGLHTAALQTSTRLRGRSYTEQLWLDPTKYSPKSTGAALQMEKNMQDFCLSYPRNPMQSLITESTQPPSSLNSQALTESLFLTLLRRPEFPFIFHLFSFLPERERRVGLLCTTNERDFVAVY